MVRSCYTVPMRFYPDRPDVHCPIRWFFCESPFVALPFATVFHSLNWFDADTETPPPLGEVVGEPRPWRSGAAPAVKLSLRPCGHADSFAVGESFALRQEFRPIDWGIPPCCRAAPPFSCPTLAEQIDSGLGVALAMAFAVDAVEANNPEQLRDALDPLLALHYQLRIFGPLDLQADGPRVRVRWAVAWDAAQVVLCVGGTTSNEDLFLEFLASLLGPDEQGGFGFAVIPALIARFILLQMEAAGVPFNLPLVIGGHSLGGCVATYIAGSEGQLRADRLVRAVTYGEPRAGDKRLRPLVAGRVLRLMTQDDVVPGLPPNLGVWPFLVNSLPLSLLRAWSYFVHAGPGLRVYYDGTREPAVDDGVTYSQLAAFVINFLQGGPVALGTGHTMRQYISALQAATAGEDGPMADCSFALEDLPEGGAVLFPWNTTLDVYRAGNAPPTAPDVAAVDALLLSDFHTRTEAGEGDVGAGHFSATVLVPLATDVRDDYDHGTQGASFDTIYVPNKNGVAYRVRFVEVAYHEGGQACKRLYLDRNLAAWPMVLP